MHIVLDWTSLNEAFDGTDDPSWVQLFEAWGLPNSRFENVCLHLCSTSPAAKFRKNPLHGTLVKSSASLYILLRFRLWCITLIPFKMSRLQSRVGESGFSNAEWLSFSIYQSMDMFQDYYKPHEIWHCQGNLIVYNMAFLACYRGSLTCNGRILQGSRDEKISRSRSELHDAAHNWYCMSFFIEKPLGWCPCIKDFKRFKQWHEDTWQFRYA